MHPTILSPDDATALVPELLETRNPRVWVYRCHDATTGWTLSAATHAEPGSNKLSLGGFRIAPEIRMQTPGFSTDREAIALAMGMEEKVHWSRVLHIGGPLGQRDVRRMVGGKCVVAPTPGARVGEVDDRALLDFSVRCFQAIEQAGGFRLTTGQDLGHGLMHDGVTPSLRYLNERFAGSAVADTSVPTGEGNFRLVLGLLRAFDVEVSQATVGLIGCGHVGMRALERLRARGATVIALEPWAERRAELEAMGVPVWAPADKPQFLAQPMDALVVNALGGTLDADAVAACSGNARLRAVCGSENLVMPDPSLADALRAAGKVFVPTELGGMMGYLTAAEEYLARLAGVPFDVETLIDAAGGLETAGYEGARRVREGGFRERFEDAVTELHRV